MIFTWQQVAPDQWRNKISELIDSGFFYFDFLTGVDRENVDGQSDCEVVAHLAKPDLSDSRIIFTQVKSELASIADLAPASSWYERECAEMYGITFTGGDTRPFVATRRIRQTTAAQVSSSRGEGADSMAGRS